MWKKLLVLELKISSSEFWKFGGFWHSRYFEIRLSNVLLMICNFNLIIFHWLYVDKISKDHAYLQHNYYHDSKQTYLFSVLSKIKWSFTAHIFFTNYPHLHDQSLQPPCHRSPPPWPLPWAWQLLTGQQQPSCPNCTELTRSVTMSWFIAEQRPWPPH